MVFGESLMANSSSIPQNPSHVHPAKPAADSEMARIGIALLDWKIWLKALTIISAVLWVYFPVLHGGWLMDDDFYLFKNPLLNEPDRLWKAWFEPGSFIEYYPIEQSVQWALWQLWHENTFGYHLANILLHAFSSLLVWRVLTKFKLRLAWLGGLLFAVHPALVESVAWMVEFKNTLSLPPFLLAICFYIEYENHRRKSDYYLAFGLFLIAMLCKISMSPFPAVLLLYAWWRRGRIDWKDIKAAIPFFIVSIALIALTLWCGDFYAKVHRMNVNFPSGGILSRIALIGETLGFYLGIVLWPFGLLPIYQRWPIEHPALLEFLPWPILIAVFYACWSARASWGRHALLGFGFFALNLAPFLGFIVASYMRFSWVMDHLLYIPIIGLIGLGVAYLDWKTRRVLPVALLLAQCFGVLLAGFLAWNSHRYAQKFVNGETLWKYTIARNSEAWPAYNNLGAIYLKGKRNIPEALNLFEESLKLNPDYFEAHYNKGLALDRLQRLPEAIEEYKEAVRVAPASVDGRMILAKALQSEGDFGGAIEQYRIMKSYAPDRAEIRASLAGLLIQMRRFPEAAEEFAEVIELYPEAASPHNDLGNVLYLMGQRDRAIAEYREAVRLNPNMVEARNNLAGALQHAGHLDEAIKEFGVAVGMDPSSPNLHINLARALAQGGRQDEAIQEYELALQLDPESMEAKNELAALRGSSAGKSPKK